MGNNMFMRSRQVFHWITLAILFLVPVVAAAAEDTSGLTIATFGKHSESVEDMRVKVLGGYIRVTREWSGSGWSINRRWQTVTQNWETTYHCKGYYDEFGTWHASVGCEVAQYFSGLNRSGVLYNQGGGRETTANGTVLTRWAAGVAPGKYFLVETQPGTDYTVGNAPVFVSVRWVNTTGEWIEYAVTDTGSFRPIRYGDKNEVAVTLHHDAIGRETGVSDHNGKQILWYEYDAEGNVSRIKDYSGRQVKYGYTGGNLTSVTDVRGQVWTYEYDEKGRLSRKTDPNNHSTAIEYTSAGTVTAITFPDETKRTFKYEYDRTKKEYYKQEKSPAGVVTETWYNDDGEFLRQSINNVQVKRIEREEGKRSEIGQDGNTTVRFENAYGNVTKTLWPDGSSNTTEYLGTTSYPTKKVDENGVVTLFEYDDKYNLIKLTEAEGRAEQRITTFTYDEYGNELSKTIAADAVSAAVNVSATYDSYGNKISSTDGEGNVTRYSHDVMGNVLTRIAPGNHTWLYTYDAVGNPLTAITPLNATTSLEYDKAGNKVKITDPLGHVTQYGYDKNDRLLAITDPLNQTISITYDADGHPSTITNPSGAVTQLQYDNAGRLTILTEAGGNKISREYVGSGKNGAGELAVIHYPTHSISFEYDKRGNKVSIITQLTVSESLTESSTYDALGNQTSSTDAKGRTTHQGYDALGRLVQSTDAAGGITAFAYDNRDNLLSVTNAKGIVIRRYAYDKHNRLISETWPDGERESYGYDDAAGTVTHIDAKGQVARYQTDDAGRLAGVDYLTGESDTDPIKHISYTRDARDQLTQVNDGELIITLSYNALGQQIREEVDYGSFSLGFQYEYDIAGRKKSFTRPDGIKIDYGYDSAGRLTGLTLPQVGTLTWNGYQWDAPTAMTLPGGNSRKWTYDGLLRPTNIESKDAGGNPLMQYAYSYDAAGNVTARQTEHGNYVYSYDVLDRLTSVDNPTLDDEAYSYDAVGNRLTDTKQAGEWIYEDDDRLTARPGVTYQYDANGSLIEQNENGTIVRYRYDIAGRLSEVRDSSDNLIASYSYDPFGRRYKKTTSTGTTYFLYSDEGLIAEVDRRGTIIRQYGWQPDGTWGTAPLYLLENDKAYFYQNDHLGTPQKLITTSGAVVWSAEYESFGQAHIATNTINNPLRLPGQYFDTETERHYNYFRDYDPELGRYVEVDQAGVVVLHEQLSFVTNHIYSYGQSNPLSYADPDGDLPILLLFRAAMYAACVLDCYGDYSPNAPGCDLPGPDIGKTTFEASIVAFCAAKCLMPGKVMKKGPKLFKKKPKKKGKTYGKNKKKKKKNKPK